MEDSFFICKFFNNLKQFFFNEILVKSNFNNNYMYYYYIPKHRESFIIIDCTPRDYYYKINIISLKIVYQILKLDATIIWDYFIPFIECQKLHIF